MPPNTPIAPVSPVRALPPALPQDTTGPQTLAPITVQDKVFNGVRRDSNAGSHYTLYARDGALASFNVRDGKVSGVVSNLPPAQLAELLRKSVGQPQPGAAPTVASQLQQLSKAVGALQQKVDALLEARTPQPADDIQSQLARLVLLLKNLLTMQASPDTPTAKALTGLLEQVQGLQQQAATLRGTPGAGAVASEPAGDTPAANSKLGQAGKAAMGVLVPGFNEGVEVAKKIPVIGDGVKLLSKLPVLGGLFS